jgi:hypothetical protein
MLLLHIIGVAPVSNKSKYSNRSNFSISFVFLCGEGEDEYDIALKYFKYYIFGDSNKQPKVFYRDSKDALGNAITRAFLVIPQLIYL